MTLSGVFPAGVVALPSRPEECLARGGPQCSMRHCAKRRNAFAQRRARAKAEIRDRCRRELPTPADNSSVNRVLVPQVTHAFLYKRRAY